MMRPIKKIVELVINHEELDTEEAGVSVVSIVDAPAIEVDFFAFKKAAFEIEPSDQEMIDGIVEILVQIEDVVNRAEVADKVMQDLVAQGIDYDSDLFLNRVGLKFTDEKHEHHILTAEQEEGILKMAAELGEDLNPAAVRLDFTKTQFSTIGDYLKGLIGLDILTGQGRSTVTKYQYFGPPAERNFCKAMLRMNRLYTIDDLRVMSQQINTGFRHDGEPYSIFDFKGGKFCKHFWNEVQVLTQADGREVYINKGPVEGDPGTAPDEMNGRGAYPGTFSKMAFAVENEDQRIIIAPAMIPNKFILRKDEETGELYYVYFTKKTIREIAERFFKKSYQNNTDVNHNGNVVEHNTLLESWIIDDPKFDKSAKYGFNLPVGSWMLSYRINNEETWQQIKRGELKGLSVEGMFIELH